MRVCEVRFSFGSNHSTRCTCHTSPGDTAGGESAVRLRSMRTSVATGPCRWDRPDRVKVRNPRSCTDGRMVGSP